MRRVAWRELGGVVVGLMRRRAEAVVVLRGVEGGLRGVMGMLGAVGVMRRVRRAGLRVRVAGLVGDREEARGLVGVV